MNVIFNGVGNSRKGLLFGNFFHMLHLGSELSKLEELELTVLADEFTVDHYKEALDQRASIVNLKCGTYNLIRQDWMVCKAVNRLRPDLYHRPTGQLPVFPLRCPTVMTIADLNWKVIAVKPHVRLYKDWSYGRSIRIADRITTISSATLSELEQYFPQSEGKTSVIYHGTPRFWKLDPRIAEGIGGPYLLTFARQPHKNVECAIRAIKQCQNDIKLVVVGSNSYVDLVLKPLAGKLGLEDRVLFRGGLSEGQLHALYQKAVALVFMSRFEGFGLPVLEAMGVGCPVICSNAFALPEVAGQAGIVLGTDDIEGVAKATDRLINDPEFRNSHVAAGHNRANEFTWERAAAETLAVYEETLHLRR